MAIRKKPSTDLASTFRSAIERAGLTLTIDAFHLPEPAYVDRDMWEKIVLNLISSAFKFTLTGGIRVRVEMAAALARSEERLALSVEAADLGIFCFPMPLESCQCSLTSRDANYHR
jgi:signal transduction histidine kinase